jgi:hypothetical protein
MGKSAKSAIGSMKYFIVMKAPDSMHPVRGPLPITCPVTKRLWLFDTHNEAVKYAKGHPMNANDKLQYQIYEWSL